MARTNFQIIRALMVSDNTLDCFVYETECILKRDITVEEENAFIQDVLEECVIRMQELSCSLLEAYKDIMQ